MRVAFYSPLPPSRSGIADYSALLLPALEQRFEVVLAREGRPAPRADVALYHVGNDPAAHGWIVDSLRRRPGVVVLHEFVLHHLVAGVTLARGDRDGYLEAMERQAGLVGRLLAHAVIDNRILPLWESRPQDFPLAFPVLDLATGVVSHSAYVEGLVRKAGYNLPVWRVPMPAWPLSAAAAPVDLGPDRSPLIGCFGHLNEAKRIAQLLRAFARVRANVPQARLLLVGSMAENLSTLRLPDGVIREEYVPEERLWSLMAACDVLVSLRWPTMGETSAVVLRGLSLGKPQLVSDVGWFRELPDDVAVKVPVDGSEIDALATALRDLLSDPGRLGTMGRAARALADSEHTLDRAADAYAAALEQALAYERPPARARRRFPAVARLAGVGRSARKAKVRA